MLPLLFGLPLFGTIAVAIELPPEANAEAAARVIESCQAVLGRNQCTLAENQAETRWHAEVRWEGVRLLVTVRRHPDLGAEETHREVVFSSSDSEAERWFAAGLMIASLAAAQSESATRTDPNETPGSTSPGPPSGSALPADGRTPVPAPAARVRGLIDVGGLVGSGLTASDPKLGALVRGWLLPSRVPVGATLSAQFASSVSGSVTARWYGGAAGIAWSTRVPASSFDLSLRGEFLFEQTRALAVRDAAREHVSSSWRGGGQFGLSLSYRVGRWFAPWVAADLSFLRPDVQVQLAGEPAGSDGGPRWAFSLGGRFRLTSGED